MPSVASKEVQRVVVDSRCPTYAEQGDDEVSPLLRFFKIDGWGGSRTSQLSWSVCCHCSTDDIPCVQGASPVQRCLLGRDSMHVLT